MLSECAWDVNAAIDRLLTSGVAMEEEEDEVEARLGVASGRQGLARTQSARAVGAADPSPERRARGARAARERRHKRRTSGARAVVAMQDIRDSLEIFRRRSWAQPSLQSKPC